MRGKDAYNDLKAAWHIDRIEQLRLGQNIAPIELQLIISDYCNHDCYFCAYRASNGLSIERFADGDDHNPRRIIDTAKAFEIVDDASSCGVRSIIFTGGGEPTVHPDHMRIFARALDLGIDCSLNTNGALFRGGWEDVLPFFSYVRFSIDAASAEEHVKIRKCPTSHYSRALRHIGSLADKVAEKGTTCVVGTGYVVTPDNYRDVYAGVRNLKEAGAHYVRLAAMQSTDGREAYGEDWDLAREHVKKCAELADDNFAVVDLMDGVLGERPDYAFCGFQHVVLYVGANLECYRCCYTAYTEHGLVGSLKDMSLAEYIDKRDLWDFDARSCEICPLNAKNKVIGYLVDPEPLHVNFV